MDIRTRTDPAVVVCYPDVIGESPAYDAEQGRLVWVDMFGGLVHELTLADDALWELGRTWDVGDFAAGVVPRASGGLLVVTRTAFVALSEDGRMEMLASLDGGDLSDVRFNDVKCDPQGRLVAGWMAEDLSRPGALVRVDGDGSVETILSDVWLANGLAWSPDGETCYLGDSTAHRIDAFDYDGVAGTLSNRRTMVTVERGFGAPNGLSVDHNGCLWVTITYGSEMRCYAPNGELADIVEMPTLRPTSCAFAGPDGRDLFITSGSLKVPSYVSERIGIPRDRIEAADGDKNGGALFVCRPGVSGPAATPFAG